MERRLSDRDRRSTSSDNAVMPGTPPRQNTNTPPRGHKHQYGSPNQYRQPNRQQQHGYSNQHRPQDSVQQQQQGQAKRGANHRQANGGQYYQPTQQQQLGSKHRQPKQYANRLAFPAAESQPQTGTTYVPQGALIVMENLQHAHQPQQQTAQQQQFPPLSAATVAPGRQQRVSDYFM